MRMMSSYEEVTGSGQLGIDLDNGIQIRAGETTVGRARGAKENQ